MGVYQQNLDIYRKWIERRLGKELRDTEVYNPGDGAEIKGNCFGGRTFMELEIVMENI